MVIGVCRKCSSCAMVPHWVSVMRSSSWRQKWLKHVDWFNKSWEGQFNICFLFHLCRASSATFIRETCKGTSSSTGSYSHFSILVFYSSLQVIVASDYLDIFITVCYVICRVYGCSIWILSENMGPEINFMSLTLTTSLVSENLILFFIVLLLH